MSCYLGIHLFADLKITILFNLLQIFLYTFWFMLLSYKEMLSQAVILSSAKLINFIFFTEAYILEKFGEEEVRELYSTI